MTATRFTVLDVVDLPVRQGLLVTGTVEGVVRAGTRLLNADGEPVEIMTLEFVSPRNREEGSVTITIPRGGRRALAAGDVLVGTD